MTKRKEDSMKKRLAKVFATALMASLLLTSCTKNEESPEENQKEDIKSATNPDQEAADRVARLIDEIYVQKRNDKTDEQVKKAKEEWDKLTEEQKKLVSGENADPNYFGRDTGDASKDDSRNQDDIGENEILVVSFGTSFNDSRVKDIKAIEDAMQKAFPNWSVRRAFTSQIIINHIQARDGYAIDNVEQALERAINNGVKNLIIQPTHLMQGAEYNDLVKLAEDYRDKFEKVDIAYPLLGEVGNDSSTTNEDKKKVCEIVTKEAVKLSSYDSLDKAKEDKTAFIFMGHGTNHSAMVTYSQMQKQLDELNYDNVFIGTVEGDENFSADAMIDKLSKKGYTKLILRPLMVVAGDHANNDMAGSEEDSWLSIFNSSNKFEKVDTQIEGLGRLDGIQEIYIDHTKASIK